MNYRSLTSAQEYVRRISAAKRTIRRLDELTTQAPLFDRDVLAILSELSQTKILNLRVSARAFLKEHLNGGVKLDAEALKNLGVEGTEDLLKW